MMLGLLLHRRRFVMSMAAVCVTATATLASPGVTRAEQLNGFGGCIWTNGPTVASTGCSYQAFAVEGSAEWLVGTGQPSVTGASGTPTCAFVGNVGGACVYAQPLNGTVSVNVPGSTAGAAGTGVPLPVIVPAVFSCVWVPLSGGCRYTVPMNSGALTGTLIYAGGNAPPTMTGATITSCTPLTTNTGTCQYAVPNNASAATTVIVNADQLSAGVAVSHA